MRKPQRRLLAGTLGLLAAVVSGTLVAQAGGIDHVTPIPARLIRGAEGGQGVVESPTAQVALTAAQIRAVQADFAAGDPAAVQRN